MTERETIDWVEKYANNFEANAVVAKVVAVKLRVGLDLRDHWVAVINGVCLENPARPEDAKASDLYAFDTFQEAEAAIVAALNTAKVIL